MPRSHTRFAALVVAFAAILLGANGAAAGDALESPSITVTGRGEAQRLPDMATISFAVETTSEQASAAAAENARKSSAVAEEIKKMLGKDDQVSTTRYSLDPVYDHHRERNRNEPPAIVGYIARNEVRVEFRDMDAVGRLIDTAAGAGANRINGLHFALKDRDGAHDEALADATADARRQATTIAASLGVELGKVLHATTSSPSTIAPRAFRGTAMAMESRAPTPVEPGEVRIDATVHVTYAIN